MGLDEYLDGWPDFVRIVNLIFGVIILIWLVVRRVRSPLLYGDPLRNDSWLIAIYWTSAMVVGTFEQFFDTETESRVVLYFFALVVTARYLWRYNHEWKERKNGDKDAD